MRATSTEARDPLFEHMEHVVEDLHARLRVAKRKLEEIHEIAGYMVGYQHADNIAATAASALRAIAGGEK